MLFCTSLLAVVGAGLVPSASPRRLLLRNTALGPAAPPLAELPCSSTVLAVRLSRQWLVVVTERQAAVHDLSSMALLDRLDTVANPRGLCALAAAADAPYLALPAAASSGACLVYDCRARAALCELRAHRAPLAALAFSADGSLLASASERGTVIRVHTLPGAEKVAVFRRGTLPTTIHSLAFGPPGAPMPFLAALSDAGTLHLFRLGDSATGSGIGGHGGHGGVGSGSGSHGHSLLLATAAALGAAGGPGAPGSAGLGAAPDRPRGPVESLVESAESDRAFATLRLPVSGIPGICAVLEGSSESPIAPSESGAGARGGAGEAVGRLPDLRVVVVSADGILYEFGVKAGTAGAPPRARRSFGPGDAGSGPPPPGNPPLQLGGVEGPGPGRPSEDSIAVGSGDVIMAGSSESTAVSAAPPSAARWALERELVLGAPMASTADEPVARWLSGGVGEGGLGGSLMRDRGS